MAVAETHVTIETNTVSPALPKEMQEHHYPILFEVEETHWWYVGRRRLLADLIADIAKEIDTPDLRILDVGCGTGANLKMLDKFGKTEGVDISEQALEFCRQRGISGVKQGAAESLPYENESFDLVTSLDVVEHLDDDAAGLREIHRVLRPGGFTLIFVPAFMFLWGVQDDVSNHRRRYTKGQLLKAMTAADLRPQLMSYANFVFFFPVLAVRWGMRLFKLRAETEYGINLPFMNRIFASLFANEVPFIKRTGLPWGVSLVCVARKAG